ncbi:MAG TPA: hypothetical protein VMU51_03955 [Mycobacteriales bacterium]|nr:hypothetical protein [Mycobacteriales bacterium]
MSRLKTALTVVAAGAFVAVLATATPAGATPGRAPAAPTQAKVGAAPFTPSPVAVQPRVRPTGPLTNALFDGRCDQLVNGTGEFCFYVSSNFAGPAADFYNAVSNLSILRYPTLTALTVAGNHQSGRNFDLLFSANLYTQPNGGGLRGEALPGSSGNFISEFANKVLSLQFLPPGTP